MPSFSIIIEWDNARFSELDRSRRMLQVLRRQINDLPPSRQVAAVIVLYDRHSIDGTMLNKIVDEELRCDPCRSEVRVVPTDGLRYYEQKNFGAGLIPSDVKIFLDCDIVPEPGWLGAMVESFDDPDVAVVAGQTYIEPNDLLGKAFALFWFFKLRDPSSDLTRTHVFYANNVAFRADILHRHPFPDLEAFRGQCWILSNTLRANGINVLAQNRARVAHPRPRGFWFFLARALNSGRDEVLANGALDEGGRRPLRNVYWNYRNALTRSFRNFRDHAREIGLGPMGATIGYSIAVAYFSLKAIGELVTVARPNLIARLFPI